MSSASDQAAASILLVEGVGGSVVDGVVGSVVDGVVGSVVYDSDFDGPNDGGAWNSYEEAMEEGLRKALKLI